MSGIITKQIKKKDKPFVKWKMQPKLTQMLQNTPKALHIATVILHLVMLQLVSDELAVN